MRRKTLWNGVKNIGLSKEKLELAFERANIDPKRRGETLTIQEFAALADRINEEMFARENFVIKARILTSFILTYLKVICI